MDCPCQSSLKYHACCGKFHFGNMFPPTVEALSRARFSAYVLNKPNFIYNTWDESTRPSFDTIKLLTYQKSTFSNYQVIHTDMGREHHDIGMLTFTATSKSFHQDQTESERGMYKRIEGKWKFLKAEAA